MSLVSHAILAGALLVASAGAAQACAVYKPPFLRLLEAHRTGFDAIALVSIASHERRPDTSPSLWSVRADVKRMIQGETFGSITFAGRDSAACGDAYPLPSVGDLWVVYARKGADGALKAHETHPLDVARDADPRLKID